MSAPAIERLGTLAPSGAWASNPAAPWAVGEIGGHRRFVGRAPAIPSPPWSPTPRSPRPLIAALGGETPPPAAPRHPPPRTSPTARSATAANTCASGSPYATKSWSRPASPRDGAGILTSLTDSDALAELPEHMTDLSPGTLIPCLPLTALYD